MNTDMKIPSVSERVQSIWQHPVYQRVYVQLQKIEKDRIYCGHDVQHFLDVARICRIAGLENGIAMDADVIYAAALLHDIGRGDLLTEAEPHEEASLRVAKDILQEAAFTEAEKEAIYLAIAGHRSDSKEDSLLARLLRMADKKARNCFCCKAEDTCNWAAEKKNMQIII